MWAAVLVESLCASNRRLADVILEFSVCIWVRETSGAEAAVRCCGSSRGLKPLSVIEVRETQLTESRLARADGPLPDLTSLNFTNSSTLVSLRNHFFKNHTPLYTHSLSIAAPQLSWQHLQCLNHPSSLCFNPSAIGEVRLSCLFPVSNTHVLHSTHHHWDIYESKWLTLYREFCTAYAIGYAHHSPTCSTLPSFPYDVPTSLAVLIVSKSEQLQDRLGWYHRCMEWAVRFACYAEESGMFNCATGGGLTRHPGNSMLPKLTKNQGIRNKFTVRGVVRGASLALCAVNVVGCGLAYTFGKREKEDKE